MKEEENKITSKAQAKIIYFESIDSTNTWAKKNVEQWSQSGVTIVIADTQTAGRGRFTRTWISPPKQNIYATYCFWIETERNDVGHIPQLLALSAAQILESLGFDPKIKWPNDLLLNGKKVGGILCETILHENKRGIICGIGLNVNMPKEMLDQIDRPATSLLAENGNLFEIKEILEKLNEQFLKNLFLFLLNDFSLFFPEFKQRSFLKKGDSVRFHDNQNVVEGIFYRLNADGSIELLIENNKLKKYFAGEFI